MITLKIRSDFNISIFSFLHRIIIIITRRFTITKKISKNITTLYKQKVLIRTFFSASAFHKSETRVRTSKNQSVPGRTMTGILGSCMQDRFPIFLSWSFQALTSAPIYDQLKHQKRYLEVILFLECSHSNNYTVNLDKLNQLTLMPERCCASKLRELT